MLVGERLPLFDEWSVVDRDLYGIAGRVREYDPDARLLVHEDGSLGLGRVTVFMGVRMLVPARGCVDWFAGTRVLPVLTGEPDARVLFDQRVSDSHRIKDRAGWFARRMDAVEAAKARVKAERSEWTAEQSERFVNVLARKDLGYRPTISVSKKVA